MDAEVLLLTACGVEDDGVHVRLYLDAPAPAAAFRTGPGVRTPLFRLLAGEDADRVRRFLARHPAWDVIRVPPPHTPVRGLAALRTAASWNAGAGTPLHALHVGRCVSGDAHRDALRREVAGLIGSVLANPTDPGDYLALRLLAEVVETAPTGADLAAASPARQQ